MLPPRRAAIKNARVTFIPKWQQIGVTDASQAAGEINQFIDVDAAGQSRPAGRFYRTSPCPSP